MGSFRRCGRRVGRWHAGASRSFLKQVDRLITGDRGQCGLVNRCQPDSVRSRYAYAPQGAIEQLAYGNGYYERSCYNDRLQPVARLLRTTAPATDCSDTSGNLAKLAFAYGGSASNNGNLMSQTISDGASWTVTQTYTYDTLDRLVSAEEPGSASWKETFGYDRWGNRWVDTANTSGLFLDGNTPLASTWFTGKNRLNLAAGTFDKAGNQLKVSPYTLAYDGENRTTAATSASNGSATYAYDGEGRRVTKVASGVTTTYVYDATGKLAAEYETGTNPNAPAPRCATATCLRTTWGARGRNGARAEQKARDKGLAMGARSLGVLRLHLDAVWRLSALTGRVLPA